MKNNPPKILIIDDDSTMTSLLSTLFEMEKYRVDHFSPGDLYEIEKVLEKSRPDVIIMDIHLNGTNGLDILKIIKHNPRFNKIKVIISSGENLDDEALKAGASKFFLKPYMPSELITSVYNLLNSHGEKLVK